MQERLFMPNLYLESIECLFVYLQIIKKYNSSIFEIEEN